MLIISDTENIIGGSYAAVVTSFLVWKLLLLFLGYNLIGQHLYIDDRYTRCIAIHRCWDGLGTIIIAGLSYLFARHVSLHEHKTS